MKMKKLLFCALLLALASGARAQSAAEGDDDAKYATELVQVGTVAPDFEMKTIDGQPFRLSELKGKTVVLDFWASWCPDCRKDAPTVVRLYEEYRQRGVEFVGVSMDTDAAAWRKAVEQYGMTYTHVSELKKFRETDISKLYGVKWIPSIVVIGADGHIKLSTVMSEKVGPCLQALTEQ